MDNNTAVQLYNRLTQTFSQEALKTLCFQMGLNWDDLPANGRQNKVRELVDLAQRTGRLEELQQLMAQQQVSSVPNNALTDPPRPAATPTIKAKRIQAQNIVQGVQQVGGQADQQPPERPSAGGTIEADDIEATNIVQGTQYTQPPEEE